MATQAGTALADRGHRRIRDWLLELIEAFTNRDPVRARDLPGQIAALAGPHFRCEEESHYPGLTSIYGEGSVKELFQDHD